MKDCFTPTTGIGSAGIRMIYEQEGKVKPGEEKAKVLPGQGSGGESGSASMAAPSGESGLVDCTPGLTATLPLKGPLAITIAAAASGALVFMSFPRFDLWPLAWVALVPLLLAIDGQRPRTAFTAGLLMGLVTNMGGFYWIHGLLVTFGHLNPWVAFPIFVLLCAYQGLMFGLWALACNTFRPNTRWRRVLLWGTFLLALEFTVPFIFPWYLGNSQYLFLPAIQIAEFLGVLGVSALLILVNLTTYELIRAMLRRRPVPALLPAVTALVVLITLTFGVVRLGMIEERTAQAPVLRVGMVEGDIGIREKENPEYVRANLLIHQRLSRILEEAGAELIVWPESAYDSTWIRRGSHRLAPSRIPLRPDPAWDGLTFDEDGILRVPRPTPIPVDLEMDELEGIHRRLVLSPQRGFSTPLFMGAVTYANDPDPPSPHPRWQIMPYNSAVLLDAHGRFGENIYDKNYRLVFGEYLPLGRRFPWLHDMIPAAGSFAAGTTPTLFQFDGRARIAPLICYEGILPRFVRKFAHLNPNVMINITNDAWFGKTSEPFLHLALTVFRSVENRLSLVRSTNTGISAFIEPSGRIAAATDLYGAEALIHDVALMENRTVYQRIGDVLGWLCTILSLSVIIGYLYRRTRKHRLLEETP